MLDETSNKRIASNPFLFKNYPKTLFSDVVSPFPKEAVLETMTFSFVQNQKQLRWLSKLQKGENVALKFRDISGGT